MPSRRTVDPKPIEPAALEAILDQLDDQLAAMLLLSLNACMHGGEIADLRWRDIDLAVAH